MSRLLLCLLGFLLALPVAAETPKPWTGWEMLLGDWVADSSHGKPGSATSGTLSFAYDLDRHVIVRRDRSDYPATAGRPAFSQAGLTAIYPDSAGALHASSFDNEGHVIEYEVRTAEGSVVFVSPPKPSSPGFRLTYKTIPTGLAIRFEIAPPGQPDKFATYVEGTVHRAPAH
ncbi:MAG TPA: hypothetical protein VGH73_03260 [Thermoanaerobaculia bacterium]|jgi:hypothetical protein